jgi:hypothetical protein
MFCCLSCGHRHPQYYPYSELWIKIFAVLFKEIRSPSGPPSRFVAPFREPLNGCACLNLTRIDRGPGETSELGKAFRISRFR